MIGWDCSQYVIIVTSSLFAFYNSLEGSPSVAVIGGEAYMRWTVSTNTDGIRYVNDSDNKVIITFFHQQTRPYAVAQNVNYTGDIPHGIMSFTLYGVTLANAGRYKYSLHGAITEIGGQDLVIAESPNVTGITELSPPAVFGTVSMLNCSAVSTSIPASHSLTMLSEWKINGMYITLGVKYNVNGTILVVSKLDRTDHQNRFSCRAYEDPRKKSEESREFILNVFYGPHNAQITPAEELAVDEGKSVNITCSAECNPPCNTFQWQNGSDYTLVSSSRSLVIPQVRREYAGVYICNITNTDIFNSTTTQKYVFVNYGPDNPLQLSPRNTSYRVLENSTVPNISCTSPCFPPCGFQWIGPVTSSTGVISLGTVDRSEMGNYTCKGQNNRTSNQVNSDEVTLFVIYGPDTAVISPNTTVYRLNESNFLPSIQCSAECFPNCTSHWHKGMTAVPGSSADTLSLGNVYRNEMGNYTCRSENTESRTVKENTLQLVVQYGPDNPLQLLPSNTSYRVVENSTIPNISCTSPCFPDCDFQWTGPVTSSTGVISLGTVDRSKRGNYTCKGINPRTNTNINSDVVTLFVLYGPDTAVIFPSTTVYRLNESNILPSIQCSAECFPKCTSHWYKGMTAVPGSPADTLSLGSVYRNETGNYTCRSQNTESGTVKENTLQLVVQYPPTVTIDSRNGSHNDTGLMINCSAHGEPEQYTYKLTHSSLLSGKEIRQLNYTSISTGVIVHHFTNLSFMDTGIYTCSVSNGIPYYRDGSLNQSVSITVQIKGAPYLTSSEFIFYAEKGQSGRLSVEFYNSLLDAQVMWSRLNNETLEYIKSSDKYNFTVSNTMVNVTFYSDHIQQPGLMATLEIRNTTVEDFTSYEVHVHNDAGKISPVTLELKPKGPPDVPRDVHIIPSSITTSSVTIRWVSGFHGGLSQLFFIEYRRQMDDSWAKFHKEISGGMSQNKDFNITVVELNHETLYLFRMYSWNTYKRSEYSTVINATTYAEKGPGNVDGIIIGSVIGAVALLTIAVALVGVLLYRRRRIPKLNSDDINQDIIERTIPESGLVDNPVYDSSGPASCPLNSDAAGAIYAEVVKPKKKASKMEVPNDVYTQVDKIKKNWKKGDAYENVDLVRKSSKPEKLYQNSRNANAELCGESFYEDPGAAACNGPLMNKDGLLYADLMLDPPTTKNGKPVIRGIENRTEYAEIAYGKRGEPLLDSDHEKENSDTAKHTDD